MDEAGADDVNGTTGSVVSSLVVHVVAVVAAIIWLQGVCVRSPRAEAAYDCRRRGQCVAIKEFLDSTLVDGGTERHRRSRARRGGAKRRSADGDEVCGGAL